MPALLDVAHMDLFRGEAQVLLHNAGFDLVELLAEGIPLPGRWPASWEDTIVMAGRFDPGLPLNLKNQTLAHVAGTVPWKGLVDHRQGPTVETGLVRTYEGLHRKAGAGWVDWRGRYAYYNAMDTAGATLPLAFALSERLGRRMDYRHRMSAPARRFRSIEYQNVART